jgi:DNA-binding MarR family transcriptional regulator
LAAGAFEVYIHSMKAELSAAAIAEMDGCVCFALRRAARTLTRFYDRAFRAHRLRATQFTILVAAYKHGRAPLAEVAERLGMDRTTLLRNVRPLARRRLVEVSPAADSKRTEIRATPAGRALVVRLYPEWKKAQVHALEALGDQDLSRSLDALGAMVRASR